MVENPPHHVALAVDVLVPERHSLGVDTPGIEWVRVPEDQERAIGLGEASAGGVAGMGPS